MVCGINYHTSDELSREVNPCINFKKWANHAHDKNKTTTTKKKPNHKQILKNPPKCKRALNSQTIFLWHIEEWWQSRGVMRTVPQI